MREKGVSHAWAAVGCRPNELMVCFTSFWLYWLPWLLSSKMRRISLLLLFKIGKWYNSLHVSHKEVHM